MVFINPGERRAILLAPVVAPVGYWVGVGLATAAKTMADPAATLGSPSIRLLGMVLAIGAPVAYAAMIVVGIPAYLALRRARRVGRLALWAVGGVVGGAVALVLQPSLRGELFSIPFPAWAGVVLGVVTAEVFLRLLGSGGERPRDAGAANGSRSV